LCYNSNLRDFSQFLQFGWRACNDGHWNFLGLDRRQGALETVLLPGESLPLD